MVNKLDKQTIVIVILIGHLIVLSKYHILL